jgi:hypothetical protein
MPTLTRFVFAAVLLLALSGCYTQVRNPTESSSQTPKGIDEGDRTLSDDPSFYFCDPHLVTISSFWWSNPYFYPYAASWYGHLRPGRLNYAMSHDPWIFWRFPSRHYLFWELGYGSGWGHPYQLWRRGKTRFLVHVSPFWHHAGGRRGPGVYGGYRGRYRYWRVPDSPSVDRQEEETVAVNSRTPVRRAGFGGREAPSAEAARGVRKGEVKGQSNGQSATSQKARPSGTNSKGAESKKDNEKEEDTRKEKRKSQRRRGGMN